MRVLYGADPVITAWVERHIPHVTNFGVCAALGVVREDGSPLAGVVFHDYQPQFATMQISMAAESARWATKNILRELLAYPFLQLGVNKCWTAMPHNNERAIRFNEGIGFVREAVLERQFGDQDAVMCRMFREDYERIFLHGKKQSVTAAAA